jgi:hypothetical protein
VEKLVVVTQYEDVHVMQDVQTISYESKEKFLSDLKEWQDNFNNGNLLFFKNTCIDRSTVYGLDKENSYEVYTLEEFFQERKVN